MIIAERPATGHKTNTTPRGGPIRVLELRSVQGTGGGPDKTILLGAAQSDPERFAVTVCYIRDVRDPAFTLDQRATRLNLDYVEVLERHSLDWNVWPALRQLVRQRSIDIVHSHDYKTDLLALLLGRAERVIPLATAHGWISNTWKERLYCFFDRRLLARFPRVITVSEPIRQTLIAHGSQPRRVSRVTNGIDPDFFRRQAGVRENVRRALGVPEPAVVLGAVGRLSKEKRFDLLLHAAAILGTNRALHVVIAGEGACRNELTELAAKLNLTDRLHLLGQREGVREVHQAFDVYVQTSDTEGIPNAVLEAMALETPVVASDVGGTGELIRHHVHGLLVSPGDPQAVASAIENVLGNRQNAAVRVAAARRRVEDALSFRARMRAVEAIYEELVAARPVG
jgi:glycosyltransferase involved in cell wall biosynthesis